MTLDQPDPLLAALADLPTRTPDTEPDARIRARCHAAMSRRDPRPSRSWLRRPVSRLRRVWCSWPRVFRPASASLVDAVLAAAVGVYGVVIVAEAFRAAGLF